MLTLTNLVGFAVSGALLPRVVFTESSTSTAFGTSYTYSGRNFSAAANDRHIIVGFAGHRNGGAGSPDLTAATIGGVSCTLSDGVQLTNGSNPYSIAGIVIAAVPNGTTGDVVLQFDENMTNMSIMVLAVYGLTSATKVTSATSSADPASVNVNVQFGDVLVVMGHNAANSTATPTGYTEDVDSTTESQNYAGGHAEVVTPAAPRTVSLDWSSAGTQKAVVSAVFR